MSGSTGKNDASSFWGSGGIVSAIGSWGNAAGNILKGLNTPKAAKTTKLPTWVLPAAIGGVILLVVMVVVARK